MNERIDSDGHVVDGCIDCRFTNELAIAAMGPEQVFEAWFQAAIVVARTPGGVLAVIDRGTQIPIVALEFNEPRRVLEQLSSSLNLLPCPSCFNETRTSCTASGHEFGRRCSMRLADTIAGAEKGPN